MSSRRCGLGGIWRPGPEHGSSRSNRRVVLWRDDEVPRRWFPLLVAVVPGYFLVLLALVPLAEAKHRGRLEGASKWPPGGGEVSMAREGTGSLWRGRGLALYGEGARGFSGSELIDSGYRALMEQWVRWQQSVVQGLQIHTPGASRSELGSMNGHEAPGE
ncbi:hypothetical protein F5Y17DRAFT_264270 [Xylariaceae sp. FL0594]|nr:hypothetical protein F5Y17DRAFT_264270 [Xylariaceae sp. FL0594]